MTKYFLMIFLFLGMKTLVAQENTRLLRFPAAHGNQLVFTYGGDLYTVNLNGGVARKLTNAPGFEMFARFSPDGSQIAFTANYDGNTEVYVMPAQGGEPKRLTHTATLSRDDVSDRMGPNNIVMGWSLDGKNVIYRSRKISFNAFVGQLFSVPATGGMSTQLPLPEGGWHSFSPDGKQIAYNRVFREFRTWKFYQGGMADDIWIHDFETKTTTNITNNPAQNIFPMWYGDDIFFVSERDRTANIFVYNAQTRQTTKVTNHTEFCVKFPSAGDKMIVYENGGDIYSLDVTTRRTQKINVQVLDDGFAGRNEYRDVSREARTVDVSPDGIRLVMSARGDVFTVPVKTGITRNLTKSPGAHDRNTRWSPDGQWIAYISDSSGEFEIYIQKQDGSEPAIQLTTGADTYKFEIEWSPDSRKILWNDKKMRLQYIDINTKDITLVEQSLRWEFSEFGWAPCSKWIVFVEQAPNRFSRVVIYNTENKRRTNVTDVWYSANSPTFSRDGKYLFFVSDRDFTPIYSSVEWNYAYQRQNRIYAVTLSADAPSPFAPVNYEANVTQETASSASTASNSPTKIDTTGLVGRIFALPVPVDRYRNLHHNNNKLYFQRGNNVYMYDLERRRETELGTGLNFSLSATGSKMLVRRGNNYYVIDTPNGRISLDDNAVDFSGLTVNIDKQAEWKQIFDECWRQMRDFFYVSNMHGVDWAAMREKYAALLPYARTKDDVNYLIGEMIGELNAGHAYINGGDRVLPRRIQQGLLGAKISKDATSGFFRIDNILEGANWNSYLRSPLTEMGVNAKEGEYITAVNGQSLENVDDIYELLVGMADRQVELQLNSRPVLTGSRKVIVIPVANESGLYYYNWVQRNIRKVDEATNGQVGYIHIPDMGADGLNEFVKHFYPQLNKKALIIDDRGNGGGNVSPMILERLQREIQRANVARNVQIPGQTPAQMMLGPKVVLINKYSASDGDLFPYGFQKHGLGTVIGTRSWGGVIGIRGSLPFIDGTDLRKPEYGTYSSDTGEWIIEGYGVDPDIVIDNDPARELAGIDDQLNKAIEVILEKLKDFVPIPPIPAAPDKSR